jgi:hypothetical protein
MGKAYWVADPRAKGGRILVETKDDHSSSDRKRRPKRKSFKAQFALVSDYWIRQLERYNSAAVYRLAHRILLEHHKCQHTGGEIILSTKVTGLPRQTRSWAIKKMVEARLIEVSQYNHQAAKVVRLLHTRGSNGR